MQRSKPASRKLTRPQQSQQPKRLVQKKASKNLKSKHTRTKTQSKCSFYSKSTLSLTTQPHIERFLPKVSSLELCNNLADSDMADLFSTKLPYKTKSLQKMEFFIMNLQKTLVSHIESIESELPHSETLQQLPETHNIPNIPIIKSNLKSNPKFLIEKSNRDPASGMLGGGIVAVLQGGNVFEKAGCNTSVIHGMMPIDKLSHMRADHKGLHSVLANLSEEEKTQGLPFSVAGISLVFHPHNPHHPTVHANYRMFQIHIPKKNGISTQLSHDDDDDSDSIYWFGGGSDLTPTYIEKDGENSQYGKHFHSILKNVLTNCQKNLTTPLSLKSKTTLGNSDNLYNFTKKWCDEYFYIPHRNETRGLGGIFYDDFDQHSTGLKQNEIFQMVTSLGDSFSSSYFPLIISNKDKKFTPEEKQFQQLRRGRYVEFNVMYDRGTKFGLQLPKTAAVRVEQILMSLPLTARYEYCYTPESGSPEENTLKILTNPIEWASDDVNQGEKPM